jgi:hypothetical protein
MYKITYRDKATNTTGEKIYNTISESKALELYRREISIFPEGYSIIDIIDLDEQNEINAYYEAKERIINEAIDNFKKAVTSILKKPYNSKNQIVHKSITINSFKNEITKEIENIIKNEDITNILIGFNKNKITLEPTYEYYQKAE